MYVFPSNEEVPTALDRGVLNIQGVRWKREYVEKYAYSSYLRKTKPTLLI